MKWPISVTLVLIGVHLNLAAQSSSLLATADELCDCVQQSRIRVPTERAQRCLTQLNERREKSTKARNHRPRRGQTAVLLGDSLAAALARRCPELVPLIYPEVPPRRWTDGPRKEPLRTSVPPLRQLTVPAEATTELPAFSIYTGELIDLKPSGRLILQCDGTELELQLPNRLRTKTVFVRRRPYRLLCSYTLHPTGQKFVWTVQEILGE